MIRTGCQQPDMPRPEESQDLGPSEVRRRSSPNCQHPFLRHVDLFLCIKDRRLRVRGKIYGTESAYSHDRERFCVGMTWHDQEAQ